MVVSHDGRQSPFFKRLAMLGQYYQEEAPAFLSMLPVGGRVRKAEAFLGIALGIAAKSGKLKTVQTLLGRGDVNVNQSNARGDTALITASRNKHVEIMLVLLAHGADTNLSNSCGDTALITACRNKHVEIILVLLEHAEKIWKSWEIDFFGGRNRTTVVFPLL